MLFIPIAKQTNPLLAFYFIIKILHLEGWDRVGGREAQEGGDMGIYVCIWLIYFVV